MNLTESYANNIGIKLPASPALPYVNFTTIPDGDYVVIESSQDLMSLNYDYFNEVVSELKNYGLKIAQIGAKSSSLLNGAEDFRGKMNFSQTCYLIQNSKLLISGDTVNSYSANYLNVPTITLYGPTIAAVNKPFYSHAKSIFIESDRKGMKASLNASENPKTINLIKPELIIQFALEILGIKPAKKINTLFIGDGYPNFIFEAIPKAGSKIPASKEAFLNIRLDRNFDEQGAAEILTQYKCSIVTDKGINPALFSIKNLAKIIYEVKDMDSLDLGFVKFMESRGASYQIITENQDIMNDLKLSLFDFHPPILKNKPEPLPNLINEKFKSTRVLFADGNSYISYWHYLNNLSQENKSLESIIPNTLDLTFWENRDSIYVYSSETI